MKKIVLMLICLVFLAGCAGTNPQLKSQATTSMEYFASVPFTALVDFHVHGNHYVDPNGKPLSGKGQSQRKGSKGLFTKKFAVAQGEEGHIFAIWVKKDNILALSVSKGTGLVSAAWNPSNIEVHFPRPITQQDITPDSIARSLSSLMVIKGHEPGAEFDDLLEDLDVPMEK